MEETRILGIEGPAGNVDGFLASGTVLADGNYIVTEPLGQGGFGITYLARDLMLERDVVIKECFPEVLCTRHGTNLAVRSAAHAPHFRKCVEMFMREARSIARLAHPNIVNVYAVFEENETAYMVLDLIEGADLQDVIEDPDRTLTPGQVRELTTKILDALTVVHGQNMLHRDLSPDNILIDKRGRPTLIDFGSAREFASGRTQEHTTLMFVKDGYSPYEFYVSGAAHSPASDLYALGGTIYHLIAGVAPPSSQLRQAEFLSGSADPYQALVGRFPDYDDAFLSAIDTALLLPSAERIQSSTEWLERISDQRPVAIKSSPVARSRVISSLGDLVSETNQHVLHDEQIAMSPVVPFKTAAVAAGVQPAWRDEFNQETEETPFVAPQSDAMVTIVDQVDPAVAERAVGPSKRGPNQFFARWFARSDKQDDDFDEIDVGACIWQPPQRTQRSGGMETAGAPYLMMGFMVVGLAMYIGLNQERINGSDGWTAVFSLEGACRSASDSPDATGSIRCSSRRPAREIDLDDRDMILKLHDSDHVR